MKSKRFVALLLAVLMTVGSLASLISVQADESVEVNLNGLNVIQQRFLRIIGSYARASYYETDVLASLMLSQGIYESGWGRSSLAVGGRNLFGIKAFSTWDGMVYDQKNSILYDNYNEYLFASGQTHVNTTSAWRAHKNWKESTDSHSELLGTASRYSAIVGEKDYSVAAKALVTAGYCADNGYAEMVIKLIDTYGLAAYDDLTPDLNGIVALTANEDTVFLSAGDTHQTELTFYPPLPEKAPETSETSAPSTSISDTSDEASVSIAWASDNPSVATVDKSGLVTAVGHGTAMITATLDNGREACMLANVDCNATVKSNDIAVRTTASVTSTSLGIIRSGTAVYVPNTTLHTDSSGNVYIAVSGITTAGNKVSGYAFASDIYLNNRAVTSISAVTDEVTLTVGESFTPYTVVSPADAADRTLAWTTENDSVATVDDSGEITAKALGTTVVTATAVGGTALNIKITVASAKASQTAYISAYSSVAVRASASDSASKSGTLYFKDKVTVTGAPNGKFYYVTGTNKNGTAVKGYVNSIYVRLVADGFTVTSAIATAGIPLYQRATSSSRKYTTIPEGTSYTILGESGEWSYIMAYSGGVAVHGYANLTLLPSPDEDTSGGDTSGGGDTSAPTVTETTYTGTLGRAKTSTKLNIRAGAGTAYASVAQVVSGTELLILSTENSWHKVMLKHSGEYITGYCHVDYVTQLYSGTTTSKLNLRSAPVSGSIITAIPKSTAVTLVGTATDGWYSVEYTVGGTTYKGYCSADYIQGNGRLPSSITIKTETSGGTSGDTSGGGETTAPPPAEDEEFSCTNPDYSIEGGVLTGLSYGTLSHQFLSHFTGNVKVYSPAGLELGSGDSVGTGCVIRVSEDGVLREVATVLLIGDINGDGLLNSLDYIQLKRHCLGTLELEGNALTAALLSGNATASATDYTYLRRAVLGTYKIEQ